MTTYPNICRVDGHGTHEGTAGPACYWIQCTGARGRRAWSASIALGPWPAGFPAQFYAASLGDVSAKLAALAATIAA
jgi:hypothetical protein